MKKILILCLVTLLLFPLSIHSANDVTEPQDSTIAKRLNAVESFLVKHKKIIDNLPRLIAYTRIGYLYNEETSNFAVNNVYLGVAGSFAKKFEYFILADLANPKILDASFAYKPFNELKLTIGQFKIPFTIGNTYSTLAEECIDFPLAIQRLVGFDDVCGIKSGGGRDIGIGVSGGFFSQPLGYDRLSYNIAIMNGNGITLKDNNKSKDIVGRISFQPSKKLIISASYLFGEYGPEHIKRNRISGGVSFQNKFVTVRTEFIGDNSHAFESYGSYLLLVGNINRKISILTRFDLFYDYSVPIPIEEINYTAGANYNPFKFLRIQANYIRKTFALTPRTNPNQFQIMVTGIF